MNSKIFRVPETITIQSIGIAVEQFFRDKKNMQTQGQVTPEGYFVQAREQEGWKKFAGMDMAIQVQIFDLKNGTINVQLGQAKWSDKALAAGAGALIFAPLLATAAFGTWKQKQLPEEIFDFIEKFILSGGQTVTVSMSTSIGSAPNQTVCPNCHAHNADTSKFCMSCGTGLSESCPNCQSTIAIGTLFCPQCGTNVKEGQKKYCQNCSAEVASDAKFCISCGTPQ